MMNRPSEKLRNLFSELTGLDGPSVSKSNIKKLKITPELVSEIKACLSSEGKVDISTGFLFLNSLLEENKPVEFGGAFFEFLVDRLVELKENVSKYVCYQALELYVWLRDNYPDYSEFMRGCLTSEDLGLRRIALHNYETYASENEISPLIGFSDDGYAAEKGMNSDLFYELRDVALEKIGLLVGRNFCSSRLAEPYDGTVVSWFDWNDFFRWWEVESANYL